MGFELPNTLMRPLKGDNSEGFFESVVLMELNDQILASVNQTWYSSGSLPDHWFNSAEAQAWQQKIVAAVQSEYPSAKQIVIKDPRINKILPLWLSALEQLNTQTSVVVACRHPIEVAKSLNKRNSIDMAHGVLLWLEHNQDIARFTQKCNRVFVDYNNLLIHPEGQISRLSAALDWNLDQSNIDSATALLNQTVRSDLKNVSASAGNLGKFELKDIAVAWQWLQFQCNAELSLLDNNSSIPSNNELTAISYGRPVSTLDWAWSNFKATRFSAQLGNRYIDDTKGQLQRLNTESTRKIQLLEQQTDELNEALDKLEQERAVLKQTVNEQISEANLYRQKEAELETLLARLEQHGNKTLNEVIEQSEQRMATLKSVQAEEYELLTSLQLESEEQNRHLRSQTVDLSHQISSLEHQLEGVRASGALRLGGNLIGKARRFRRSFFGRSLLFVKAALSFRLSSWLHIHRNIRFLQQSNAFDEEHYLSTYPVLRYSRLSPIEHYVCNGEAEGRLPCPTFNPRVFAHTEHYEPGSRWCVFAQYLKLPESTRRDINTHTSEQSFADPSYEEIDDDPTERASSKVTEEPHVSAKPDLSDEEIVEQLSSKLSFSTPDQPIASVIIPTFNNLVDTLRCFEGLMHQSLREFEVIVIDDASTIDMSALDFIEGITLVRNRQNLGYLHSANKGASIANGEYIVQLNNDTIPSRNWLKALLAPMQQTDTIGLVGSQMLASNGLLQEAGGVIFADGSGYNYGRSENPHDDRYSFIRDCDYCSGASIALPASVWRKLKGYDPFYTPAYYEDTDLAMRVREMGLRVVYTPFSKLVHIEGVSCGSDESDPNSIKRYQAINRNKFVERWSKQLTHYGSLATSGSIHNHVAQTNKLGRLLWVDAVTPTPDQDAGSIDTMHHLVHLRSMGWDVTFAPWDGYRYEPKYTDQLRAAGIRVLCQGQEHVLAAIEKSNIDFDVLTLSRAPVAIQVYKMLTGLFPKAKVVFNTVDLHYLRYQRELDLLKSQKSSAKPKNQPISKKDEIGMIKVADTTLVVSHEEKKILEKELSKEESKRVVVIPSPRDIYRPSKGFDARVDVAFLGSYQHPPNLDAVDHFLHNIWPKFSARMPDVKFIIAGSSIPERLSKLKSKSIVPIGFVENLEDLLGSIRLMIAPLRYGAGIKGKVISSMCYGVPQVATQIAAEGMPLTHGKELLIAKSDAEFVEHMVELYTNQALWNTVSEQAIKAVEKQFASPQIKQQLNEVFNPFARPK